MSGKLFVVGTPIGNLGDFSPRAIETLNEVDFIAAEDTRITLKLLNHFDIHTPMICYFEHNIRSKGELIIQRILEGENCAIVTDAGMPAISDPGQDLVKLCHEHNIQVCAVPGPTAFATALAISGMATGRFSFEGFLSMNKPSRREHLESLVNEKRTMVFYEAPHKLTNTLKDFVKYFGEDRHICIVREITKIYEEVIHASLKEALERFGSNNLKGELVLIIEGAGDTKEEISLEDAVLLAKKYIDQGFSSSMAAKQAAKETGLKKGDIYKELLEEEN